MTDDHLTGHDGPAYPSATDGEAAPEFTPSASFTVDDDGRRDIGLCFVGDSFTAGYGDPKALGWVGRVVSRTHHPDVEVTAYLAILAALLVAGALVLSVRWNPLA